MSFSLTCDGRKKKKKFRGGERDGIVVDAGLMMMGVYRYRQGLDGKTATHTGCKEKESNRKEDGKSVFPMRLMGPVPVSTLAVLWPLCAH